MLPTPSEIDGTAAVGSMVPNGIDTDSLNSIKCSRPDAMHIHTSRTDKPILAIDAFKSLQKFSSKTKPLSKEAERELWIASFTGAPLHYRG